MTGTFSVVVFGGHARLLAAAAENSHRSRPKRINGDRGLGVVRRAVLEVSPQLPDTFMSIAGVLLTDRLATSDLGGTQSGSNHSGVSDLPAPFSDTNDFSRLALRWDLVIPPLDFARIFLAGTESSHPARMRRGSHR